MQTEKAYRRLVAFQRADNLVATVYQVTKDFPEDEQTGLKLHMRQVAYAIPLSIAQGYTQGTRAEFYQGIKLACSSLSELEYIVDLTLRLGYITTGAHNKLSNEVKAAARSLYGLLEGLGQKPGITSLGVIAEAGVTYALAI